MAVCQRQPLSAGGPYATTRCDEGSDIRWQGQGVHLGATWYVMKATQEHVHGFYQVESCHGACAADR